MHGSSREVVSKRFTLCTSIVDDTASTSGQRDDQHFLILSSGISGNISLQFTPPLIIGMAAQMQNNLTVDIHGTHLVWL